jgi:hypothetical protein
LNCLALGGAPSLIDGFFHHSLLSIPNSEA